MNMEFIIANASQLLVVVAVICTLISVITEFTKEIDVYKRQLINHTHTGVHGDTSKAK